MFHNFSLSKIQEDLLLVVKRFPITLLFTFVWTVLFEYIIVVEESSNFINCCIYFSSIATIISLFFEVWREELNDKRKVTIGWVLTLLVLCVDTYFLFTAGQDSSSYYSYYKSTQFYLTRASAIVSFLFGVVIISFIKEKNDIQSWNFGQRLLRNFAMSFLLGVLSFGALSLLIYGGLNGLLDINVDESVYFSLCVFFLQCTPIIIFLLLLPKGQQKHDNNLHISKFLNNTIRYLFIPILLGYFLVMYVYLFKIILSWNLPKGTVSWMVSVMMLILVIIEYSLYPNMQGEAKPFEKWASRWAPCLALPLLLLMSVGIGKRLLDYGITISRIYLLIFNLWFYLLCIGFIINKNKRFNWVIYSFCGLFLLSSFFPVNVSSITKHVMESRIENLLNTYEHPDLPMEKDQYIKWLNTLSEKDKEQMTSTMKYCKGQFGYSSTEWVYDGSLSDLEIGSYNSHIYCDFDSNADFIDIPDGYLKITKFNKYDYHKPKIKEIESNLYSYTVNDTLQLFIDVTKIPNQDDTIKGNNLEYATKDNPDDNIKSDSLTSPATVTSKMKSIIIPTSQPNLQLVATRLYLKGNSDGDWDIDVEGYLFSK